MEDNKKLTGLIIMDGFGLSDDTVGNAIRAAKTPVLDGIFSEYPTAWLEASGRAVGLPEGQMGNSEVGHLNIGAGRVIFQELTRISDAAAAGTFADNAVIRDAINAARDRGTALHLMGLVSDGGVHSHITHLTALVRTAAEMGIERVYVHCFTDGRDVLPTSGAGFIAQLENALAEIGVGRIATVTGRYFAMDRDNRWERVKRAYDALVGGMGRPFGSAGEAVRSAYERGETDEFIEPSVVMDGGRPVAVIGAGDSVIFFNFRPDRARELTRALTQEDFSGFDRELFPLHYVCMTRYDATFRGVSIAFAPEAIENTLGRYLADLGKAQFRIAETEKYAHVTFFFNGGVEAPNPGEDRYLIPSPKVATYDLKPEMSAYEVTAKAIEQIEGGKYDVMIMNFANPDMVGHTGVFEAAVAAVEAVDACVGRVTSAILAAGGEVLLTADHGNAEQMLSEDGSPFTAHTTSKVPVALISDRFRGAKLRNGRLCDLAPTLLHLMGMQPPPEMTGQVLIQE